MSIAPAVRRPSSLRRWLRRLIMLAMMGAVTIGSFVGWHLYRRHVDAGRLQETIAELDARDPRWRLEHLEADRAVVPDAENSANVIRAVRAQISPRMVPPNEDAVDLQNLDPPTLLTDAQFREVIDLFESVESAVAPALSLESFARGRHPITYTADGISTLLRHVDDMSQTDHRVLWPLLLLHLHENDPAAAARDCVCIANLGRSIGDEPFAISQLTRLRFVVTAARGVERLLGQVTASEGDLKRLQAIFAEEAARDAWPAVVRGERAVLHRAMVALGSGILKTSVIRQGLIQNPRPQSAVGRMLEWLEDRYPPDLTATHEWHLRRATLVLEQTAALPWHERTALAAAIIADDANAPELGREWWFATDKLLVNFQRYHAMLRCTLVALAAERYWLRHGAWPQTTAKLVPEFLPDLPLDPFDGQPLRYKRLPDGVVIYSVGADGIDDGGRISPTLMQQPMTDIGVRLWDVNRRRRPPPAAEKQP
jgi:hypothetical protein